MKIYQTIIKTMDTGIERNLHYQMMDEDELIAVIKTLELKIKELQEVNEISWRSAAWWQRRYEAKNEEHNELVRHPETFFDRFEG